MGVDAWSIGVDLALNDQIFAGFSKVDDRLEKIQSAVNSINDALGKTGDLLTTAAGGAAGLASSLKSAATAAERIQKAVAATNGGGFGGGFGGGGGGVGGAAEAEGADADAGRRCRLVTGVARARSICRATSAAPICRL